MSHTNHPEGLSALSVCSFKYLCHHISTGTEERAARMSQARTALPQLPWTGGKGVWGCDGGALKPLKKPNLATGFSAMLGAPILGSMDGIGR